MSRADVAKRLGISERTLKRNLAAIGGLQCYMIGRLVKFSEADISGIQQWIASRRERGIRLPKMAPSIQVSPELAVNSEIEIVGLSQRWPKTGTGIYFLIMRSRVVYVGQAKNVASRIASHAATKRFTGWHWVPCKPKDLDQLERAYIDKFLPKLNRDGRTLRMKSSKEKAPDNG